MQSLFWSITAGSEQAGNKVICTAFGYSCWDRYTTSHALSAQDLDLSCNNIGALANLGACRQLTRLDLSNNCLSCLARAQQMCGGLRRLVLRVRCAARCCAACARLFMSGSLPAASSFAPDTQHISSSVHLVLRAPSTAWHRSLLTPHCSIHGSTSHQACENVRCP